MTYGIVFSTFMTASRLISPDTVQIPSFLPVIQHLSGSNVFFLLILNHSPKHPDLVYGFVKAHTKPKQSWLVSCEGGRTVQRNEAFRIMLHFISEFISEL